MFIQKLIADVPLGPKPLNNGVAGTLANVNSDVAANTLFTNTLSKIIGVMTVVAFIWFTFMIVIGALRILTSGGDKGAVESARKQISTAVIGVVLVVAAIFIVDLIGFLLGLNNILNPICIIQGPC